MKHSKILEIANNLSNEEICRLIFILSDRLDVYIGRMGEMQITSPISSVGLNGPTVQINLETSELDDMREDDWISDACLTLFGDEFNQ